MSKTINEKLSITVIFLAIYFVMLPLDFLPVKELGSITKLLAIFPAICLVIENKGKLLFSIKSISNWILFFLLISFFSLFYTISFENTCVGCKTLFLNSILVVLMSLCRRYNEREIAVLEKSLIVGGWITVLTVAYIGLTTGFDARATISIGEIEQDPNYLCGYMLFAFSYYFRRLLLKKKMKDIIISLLFITVVILTGSRGGLLAFIVCVVTNIFLLKSEKETRFKTVVISLFVIGVLSYIVVVIVVPMIDASIVERYSINYLIEKGTTGRVEIWKYLFEKYADSDLFTKIFGSGYNTTILVNDMSGYHNGKVAHNLYIDNLISLGVIGLISQLGIQLSAIKISIKNGMYYYFSVLFPFVIMCFSMSLTSYKPLWCVYMMIIIAVNNKKE